MIGKLTALKVERTKKPGTYGDGGGLYAQVSGPTTGSWVFKYTGADGRRREMGLGSFDTYGLAEARALAHECRKLVAEGRDPIEQRRAARLEKKLEASKAVTFKECAVSYIAAHQAGWRNPKHRAQWPSTLETYAYPILGDLPVQAIDTALVMKAIEPIWNKKPETASRVRGRIESVLDWATARTFRAGENPARWKGHLENLLPKKTKIHRVEHHAALPYAELPAFMIELRGQEGVAARALEFVIFTAGRTGEVLGARWDEFSLTERLWTVPASRMKADREHRVPLSDAALAIVEQMAEIRHSEFVFPGGRPGRPLSNMVMLVTMRRMGRGDLTSHGFRSSFSDWCAERTNFPRELREMALAHAVSDKVEAAYRRGDMFQKRRQLMDAWARFCITPPAVGKVVAFAAK